jgi:hypothetical protein
MVFRILSGARVAGVLLIATLWFGSQACAQTCTGLCLQQTTCPGIETTSISGTVYAPNGTDPLPNVLVYVPNAPVAALPAGVSCELAGETVSGSPLVSTTTARDGSFTLTDMPVGANIPLVIQAGKWRRQVSIANVASCTNTAISASQSTLPRNQSEGDIPQTAVVTGSVDAAECVLRKIGIDDTEFTDPSGTGRINFYLGTGTGVGNGGAQISPSTPNEIELWHVQAILNKYDLVMFPCQGGPYTETASAEQNLLNYVNAGGRVFATHYSYAWFYNYSPFSDTADWAVDPEDNNTFADDPGTGIINTTFPKGNELAQWLQGIGASTTFGQIPISTLRHDFTGVVAPSTLWLSDEDAAPPAGQGTVPMQYTFNTPVNVSAANQCGRVVFNDYHVEDAENNPTNGMTFPEECAPGPMTPQEKLLEFTLFDLSNFLAPDIPPTIFAGFVNNPSTFTMGDASDTITINVSNTSTETDASATLKATVSLSPLLTPLTMQGVGGSTGWTCNVGTLTCARSTGLNKGASDSIAVTVSVGSVDLSATGAVADVVISDGGLASSASGTETILVQAQSGTTTTASNASATFSSSSQSVPFQATVTSSGGTVNTGTVTFSVLGPPVGSPVTSGTVTNGVASANFTLPGGTSASTYTIVANYSGGGGFLSSSNSLHLLTISPAATTTAAASQTVNYGASAQNVTLAATVSSSAGVVNEGTVSFVVSQNSTTLCSGTSATVSNGAASATCAVPGGTEGVFNISATYNPGTDYTASSDSSQTLTIVVDNTLWIGNSNNTSVSFSAAGIQGATEKSGGTGMAIDSSGNVWSLNSNSVAEFDNLAKIANTYTDGGLSSPTSLAIDGAEQVWITNASNSISVFASSGSPISTAAYSGGQLNAPSGVAIDISGNVWIANSGGSSVTKVLGAAVPTVPLATGVVNGTPATEP